MLLYCTLQFQRCQIQRCVQYVSEQNKFHFPHLHFSYPIVTSHHGAVNHYTAILTTCGLLRLRRQSVDCRKIFFFLNLEPTINFTVIAHIRCHQRRQLENAGNTDFNLRNLSYRPAIRSKYASFDRSHFIEPEFIFKCSKIITETIRKHID